MGSIAQWHGTLSWIGIHISLQLDRQRLPKGVVLDLRKRRFSCGVRALK